MYIINTIVQYAVAVDKRNRRSDEKKMEVWGTPIYRLRRIRDTIGNVLLDGSKYKSNGL